MDRAPDTSVPYDETDTHTGVYRSLLRQLDGTYLDRLARRVQADVDRRGCVFAGAEGDSRFLVDPVPRVLGGREWDALAGGLRQRVAALERFVADVYGAREIFAAGVVPERVLAGAQHHEPQLAGLPVRTWITVAGLDLVRGADGRLRVLEDNTRTPSGMAYLQAARRAVARRVSLPSGRRLRAVAGLPAVLGDAIRAAAPEGVEEPFAVVLSDGPANSAWWEHVALARGIGAPLVTPERLCTAGRRLWCEVDGRSRPVDVVYRRTDEDRLVDPSGRPTGLGELLADPLAAGEVAVVNAFGTGVADDKLVHAYVEDMVRFYLGEQPELRSVPTYDLSDERCRAEALERLDELVVKPRAGHGGEGVVIGPHATASELRALRDTVLADPDSFVAQEMVMLSRHPTVAGRRLAPRHVDLRPFVISSPERRYVLPGGLTRVALDEGQMIVNSSRNGGAKDTWVLD